MPVVEFNSWQVSGQNITAAFFSELGAVLGKSSSSAAAKKSKRRLEKYAAHLALGGSTLEKVGIALGVAGVPFSEYVKAAGKVTGSIAKTAKQGADAEEAMAAEAPLSTLKTQLAEALLGLDRPVLIVIDDIDRLTSEEVREVIQLTKANADFPNLIYLLLFERRVVSEALDQISGNRGYEFLEKVVQVGYHVPHASPDAVQRVLFSGLDSNLKIPGVNEKWEAARWHNLFRDGLAHYFVTLRDVYRFLTSFGFHVDQFRTTDGFEVNPVDLIGLEVLRVFEPDVYELLPRSQTILTRDPGKGRIGETKQEIVAAGFNQILEATRPERRGTVKKILELVFPPVTAQFGGREGLSSAKQEWLRLGRVCHSDLFEKYFTLVVPATDLSQIEMERLIKSANDQRVFLDQLRALRSRGLLGTALNRADAYRDKVPLESLPSLIRSLCEFSDELDPPEPASGFFFFDSLAILWRLVYFGLRREKQRKRFRLLRDAFINVDALLLPLEIITTERRSQDKDNRGFEYLLTESELSALTSIVLDKVRVWAADGRLRTHPRAEEVLFEWARLGEREEVRGWLTNQLRVPKNAAWVVSLLMSRASSNGETRYYIQPSFVQSYVALEEVEKALRKVNDKQLSEKEAIAVREFRRALKRKREGKPELDSRRLFETEHETAEEDSEKEA